jgi:DNA-directed RNA polymerase subunit RPC12/RpoP
MQFNHIYYGVFVGSTLIGVTGCIQAWNLPQGWQKSLALTIGVGGTTSALVCTGLGIAYSEKHELLIKSTEEKIQSIEATKNRELTDLKIAIDNLKSSIKVLETQEGKYTEQISNLKAQLNEKSEQFLRIVAEKDLKISELQGIVNERDQRVEEFLEDSRQYTKNFFSLRYNQLASIEKDLKKLEDSPAIQQRLKDVRELKDEMYEATEEIKKLDIKDFKTVLDFIFEFDNKFLGMKVKWRNSLLKSSQQENKELKESLDNSIPKPVAIERFQEGLEDVDARITEKYENLLLNNNSIHAQLLDLLEKRNLVIDDLTKEVETLQNENKELQKPLLAIGTSDYALAANRIANYYHENYGYKLDVINWTETETGYSILFATRRNPGLTEDMLLPHNTIEQLAAFTNTLQGTFPKFTFNYQHSTVTLDITLRKPVSKEVTVEDIFRECGIIRAELFGQTIRKHHIEKTGKPTLRVMSATGGGKGIAVKNLLNYYLHNLDGYEIWLSDPQHGSEEDYWDCEKAATNPNQASNLFNKFAQLLRSRDSKTSTDPKTPILAIFDEFDKKHDLDDKKTASEIWTTIRHHSMRLILIGQSGEVGKNRWTWDEMNNCCLLFISNAIDTFIKHADKDLGMNSETLEKFTKNYNKASKWIAKANENISPENQYRLAALYCNGQALLLEIPVAHKGILSDGKSWLATKPFEKVANNNVSISQIIEEVETEVSKPVIACPHCNSLSIKKNGKDKATKTIQQYKCNTCGKGFSENDVLTNSNSSNMEL